MYYFASDIHLGHGDADSARERERLFVQWLDEVSADAEEIYLLGDIFDFWYEWREVVPAGFVRVLGKLAELTDRGITIHFLTGNHDMWMRGYLERECGLKLYYKPTEFTVGRRHLLLAHGDNINVQDKPAVAFMNAVFRSRVIRALFSWLVHPDISMRFGKWWSGSSRKNHTSDERFDKAAAPLLKFAEEYPIDRQIDGVVFGHIHHAGFRTADNGREVWFLGEWTGTPVYGVMDDKDNFSLKPYGKK